MLVLLQWWLMIPFLEIYKICLKVAIEIPEQGSITTFPCPLLLLFVKSKGLLYSSKPGKDIQISQNVLVSNFLKRTGSETHAYRTRDTQVSLIWFRFCKVYRPENLMYKKGSFPLRICSVNVANRKKMRIWSRLLKELSMGNFFFLQWFQYIQ